MPLNIWKDCWSMVTTLAQYQPPSERMLRQGSHRWSKQISGRGCTRRRMYSLASTCNLGPLFGEHRFPARQLRLHEAAELLGRRVLGDEAHVVEALADLGARRSEER